MKTKTPTCCNKATFASEAEARRYWDRMAALGVSRVLPTDVEMCYRGWHLTFPAEAGEVKARKSLKRTQAKRAARPKPVPATVKGILRSRSGGLCEVGLTCAGLAPGTDPAHREGKGTGGTAKWWSNLASNLTWSCRPCHDLIDGKQPARAERLGLKIRAGVARPVEMPVLHARLGWVLLAHYGDHRPAPAGSHEDGRRPVPVVLVTEHELVTQGGAFAEAMERYGHLQCPGWPDPLMGLFTCGCGSAPFLLDVIA